ncbi:hypothetical protein ACFLR7_00380 [Acidobacteriota bacterium]
MKYLIRLFLLIVISMVMAVCIFLYLNQRMYLRAFDTSELKEKISILEKAESLFPYNDLVYYELGNSFLELGLENLEDKEKSRGYLDRAIESYRDSIRMNPASQFSHFQLARSIFNRNIVSESLNADYISEYKRAASRVTYSSEIYFECAKHLLSRWQELGNLDKQFTLDIMREIFRRRETENIRSLMQVWYLNSPDYTIMERILPQTVEAYRMYAKFLGERSLSLEERHKWLARAEVMEFNRAKNVFRAGKNAYAYYRLNQAEKSFEECLGILDRIRFYQDLISQDLITASDFDELRMSLHLNLGKCRAGMGKELKEFKNHFLEYLKYDPTVNEVSEIVDFLIERGVLNRTLDINFNDLERLAFQLQLLFKQSMFQDIIQVARVLRSSTLLISPEERETIVSIFLTLAAAYEKNHSIFDSIDLYKMALENDSNNLEAWLRLRDNYEKLSQLSNLRNVDKRIDALLSRKEIRLVDGLILSGESLWRSLLLHGHEVDLDFQFEDDWGEDAPMITVVLNGRVVWEDYCTKDSLSLHVETRLGGNMIQVTAVNRPIRLLRLAWRAR